MIKIDTFEGWGREELYFCTTCHHESWITQGAFGTEEKYTMINENSKLEISPEAQEKINTILAKRKKESNKAQKILLFLFVLSIVFIVFFGE